MSLSDYLIGVVLIAWVWGGCLLVGHRHACIVPLEPNDRTMVGARLGHGDHGQSGEFREIRLFRFLAHVDNLAKKPRTFRQLPN